MSDAARASDRLHISVSPAIKQVMPEFKISRAVRAGQWLFTNGQMDMGAGGKVLNPGDLMAQTFACMRSVYEVMAKADCRLAELAQLQIFYLATSVADERVYRSEILAEFPECADVLIIMTPVPSFATVGSEVEIDAIAVKGRRAAATDADGAVQAVRRGDWLFASSRAAPGTPICDGLRAALARRLADQARYSQVVDGRFQGGHITRHFGRPDEGWHAVQLEMCWRCYMDETPVRWNPARAAEAGTLLRELVLTMRDWHPSAPALSIA